MGGSSEKIVPVFDDEASSVASFEAIGRDGSSSADAANTTTMTADEPGSESVEMTDEEETVPDLMYVVEYLGYADKVLKTIKSTEPFNEVPSFMGDKIVQDKTKKPILEIVTRASTVRAPNPQSAFDVVPVNPVVYRSDSEDSYSSDSDYDDGGNRRIPHERFRQVKAVDTRIMKIHSPHLINTLQAVVKYYPYMDVVGKVVSIKEPYEVLFHHRKALEEFKYKQPLCHDREYHETTVRHIDVLLNFLETSMGDRIREEEARHRQITPLATFDNYWLLLKPGEVVLTKKDHVWTPFVISNVPGSKGDRGRGYIINCWSLASDGSHITRTMNQHRVAAWTGEVPIQTLSVIPAAFFPNDWNAQRGMSILQWQAHLGRFYWDLLKKPTYMDYDGMLVGKAAGRGATFLNHRGPSGWMTGRVVVDADGFAKNQVPMPPPPIDRRKGAPPRMPVPLDHLPHFEPRCGCEACANDAESSLKVPLFYRFDGLDPQRDFPPHNELFYIALSPCIPAFILGDRRWGLVNLAHLRPVKTDREAFKWLVLDEEIKTMIRALISKYSNKGVNEGQVAPWANDFVKNKGEGRVFLLHGSPGVGKTCTAEAVAEMTGRPLISLTSGDLSTNEMQVESNLSYYLGLGQRYGALVLLDEADVYLERRHSKDILRNGLVSVFLRALEYYRGMLFLTTNRVQTFDPAFTSRIHVALHYNPLTDADRERIWANGFERLDRDSDGRVHVSAAVREYAYASKEVSSLRWNGREIRNAMQTALALAEAEATEEGLERITITDKHLRSVVKMSRGFKDYLRSGHGWDDAQSDVVDDESDA